MKKSIIIWTIALILVATAVYTTYQYNTAPKTLPAPAQVEAPVDTAEQGNTDEDVVEAIDAIDFKLNDLNGNEIALSDYKGRTIYLNFWATWCPPCREEMPFIEQLYKETKDTDLVILTVDLQESKSVVNKFMTDNKYTFPVLLDTEGDVASMYGIQSIPISILINKDFKIVSALEGSMDNYEMMKDFVEQLKETK